VSVVTNLERMSVSSSIFLTNSRISYHLFTTVSASSVCVILSIHVFAETPKSALHSNLLNALFNVSEVVIADVSVPRE
jgi:hypothetical protein